MPSYRSLRSAKPPKLNLKTAETEQISNNSGRSLSMSAAERRILYELARSEQRKPIRNLAKACKISPKTTRNAIKKLTGDGIITANHTIQNPKPWQFPKEYTERIDKIDNNLPAKVFVAAVEILKHPELSHTEIAERTGTSRRTAIRADRILTTQAGFIRLEHTNSKAATKASRQALKKRQRHRKLKEIMENPEQIRLWRKMNQLLKRRKRRGF